jgi:hypothetical protein
MKKTIGEHANYQLFPFYNVKDHGCVFHGENFHHKRKRWTQLGSHIVIETFGCGIGVLVFHMG